MKKTRVVAAMSGGVDSSVTAYLLKEMGHEVIGITMKLWKSNTTPSERSCCGTSALDDARRVAQMLDVPYYAIDMAQEFENTVIKNFIDEYNVGRTPNPCVQCQISMKFGTLLAKARSFRADYVATGHYAKLVHGGRHQVFKASADEKDQSYAFWPLTQKQLSHILLPLGDLPSKAEVRAIAKKIGLHVAEKKDSQEICFISSNYRDFLAERGTVYRPGEFVTTDGKIVGLHNGHQNFTVGQRKGLNIAMGEAYYVAEIQPTTNRVVIGKRDELNKNKFRVIKANWSGIARPSESLSAFAKIRYGGKEKSVTLIPEGDDILVEARDPVWAASPGQSAVFYDKDGCVLAGGYIA